MKVLFVTNYLNYHQSLLFDELKKKGLNFVILCTQDDDSSIKPKVNKEYCIFSWNISNDNVTSFLNAFDIIVYSACLDKRFLKMMPKKSIIFHNSEHYWKKINTPISLLKRIVRSFELKIRYKGCERLYLLSNSYYLNKEFRALGISYRAAYKFGYFPPVNTDCESIYNPRTKLITYIGRAIKLKHIEHSIIALSILEKKYNTGTLSIYSEGPELKHLKRKAKHKNVEFFNFLPHDEVIRNFLNTNVFVFSSGHEEGWGATLNEALSCGCVVFASNKPGSTNYLIKDGYNGFVYRTKKELKEKINYFLSLSKEDVLKIRKNAFDTINLRWNERNAANGLNYILSTVYSGEIKEFSSDGPLSFAD